MHLGLAAERAQIALERVALNVMDYSTPDNEDYQPVDEPCVPGGPAAYFSTLPLREIVSALHHEAIPAYLSNTAGTYVCNYTMYSTLHAIHARALGTRAGLIHLPLLPSMIDRGRSAEPSMDFAVMLRGVEAALRVIAGSDDRVV